MVGSEREITVQEYAHYRMIVSASNDDNDVTSCQLITIEAGVDAYLREYPHLPVYYASDGLASIAVIVGLYLTRDSLPPLPVDIISVI